MESTSSVKSVAAERDSNVYDTNLAILTLARELLDAGENPEVQECVEISCWDCPMCIDNNCFWVGSD